jgi:TolA-binding protein
VASAADAPPAKDSAAKADAPKSGNEGKAVSPTAPQAEDKADVGDSADAPKKVKKEAPRLPPNTPIDDSTTKARYQSLKDAVDAFELEAKESRDEVRRLAERKYKERRSKIEDNYRRAIDPIVKAEREKRIDAIAAFEAFLDRHPNDDEFTPDAIFRLAELYFEKYDDDYQVASKEYKQQLKQWEDAGKKGDAPTEPAKRFDKTIALYQRLIHDYPDYRLIDGAYYLLGYTQRAQGQNDEGMATWMALVERFPKSRFFAEVWFRIGDSNFDDEKWNDAIAAFLHVVPLKDSDFYDKGLYKLAWTYYLINKFDDSVARFFELLDYSYSHKDKQTGEHGSVLEEESVQYVAISFGDDNWKRPEWTKLLKGKSVDDPDADVEVDYVGFAKDYFNKAAQQDSNKAKPYERDVMARLGQNLFKQSKHAQAVAALDRAIELDPMNRDAPKLQDMIVQCYVRERQFDKANAARDVLVKTYAENTPWGKKWANDSEARKAAEDFARTNLYSAALYYHQQATQYFNDNKPELAINYFKAASDAYKAYLDRYPHDKNAYELGYYLAETYYYSLRFDDAVAQYEKTRDSPAGTKYRAESALNAVYAYEKIIDAQVQGNKLEKLTLSTGQARDPNAKPKDIPEIRQKYIAAIDKFLEKGSEHEMAPAFGYRAGEVLYAYGHYDDAVQRFQIVVDKFPQTEAAKFASNLILDDLLAKKDWKSAAAYAEKLQTNKVGGQENEAEIAKIKGGAEFEIAKDTLEQGRKLVADGKIQEGDSMLESGAEQYLKLVAEDPKREFADSMVYNAALSLEAARRPLKAAALYERLYKEYPKSEHAPEAMYRVALKNEQAFNFDKAVSTYLDLVKQYPKTDQAANSQVNAGLALEGAQKYDQAAKELERYATLFPDKPDAPDVFFRASEVYKKKKDPQAELDVLKRFVGRYESRQAQMPKVIQAQAREGELYDQLGQHNMATSSWQAAVKNFDRAKGSPIAAEFAAHSAFNLDEQQFQQYAKIGIVSHNAKTQIKELEAKATKEQDLEKQFAEVITTYKRAEWSLASLYRIGSLYDNLQQTVLKSPCPDDIKRQFGDAGCDEYRNAVEDRASVLEQKAVEHYKIAFDKANELHLTNEWTKKTLAALNLLRPQDYPIDKEPLAKPAKGSVLSIGPVLPDGGAGELKQSAPGPGEALQKGSGT